MKLNAKETVKLLITKEGITQKDLVKLMTEKSAKSYNASGLSRKLNQGTITFNEVVFIADILGYDLVPNRRENNF